RPRRRRPHRGEHARKSRGGLLHPGPDAELDLPLQAAGRGSGAVPLPLHLRRMTRGLPKVHTSEFDTPGERPLRSKRMRPTVPPFTIAAVLLLGMGAGRAAQGPAKPPATLERAADIPDAEKLSRSRDAVSRMRSVLTEVLGRL